MTQHDTDRSQEIKEAGTINTIVEAIILIHDEQIEEFGGGQGVRDRGLIESSVGRVRRAMEWVDLDAISAIAMLAHSLINNHPFIDGNKRTAFGTMHAQLDQAGYEFTVSDKEIEDTIVEFANGDAPYESIADWIRESVDIKPGVEVELISDDTAYGI